MTSDSTGSADPATSLRTRLRRDLTVAMKERRHEKVGALRTLIAAIDNAQAIIVADDAPALDAEPIAGSRHGIGSTDAERATLDADDVHAIVRAQIDEYLADAELDERHGHNDLAGQLRGRAAALRPYLADVGGA